MGEIGSDGAGTSPAGALANLPCCHTNGDTICVGLKDGGEGGEGHGLASDVKGEGRGLGFFFPSLLSPRCGVICCRPRRPEMGSPGRGVADGKVGRVRRM